MMPYGYKQPCQAYSIPPNWGNAATGAQNLDPSPQILVGMRKKFVIDLVNFGTKTEKGCPPLLYSLDGVIPTPFEESWLRLHLNCNCDLKESVFTCKLSIMIYFTC